MKTIESGQTFGRLTVLEPAGRSKDRRIVYRCLCKCGNEVLVEGSKLKSGNTKSCGCLRAARAKERHLKHGAKGTRLYNIWKNARQRCRNPKCPDYELYGARGIQFSEVWDNFEDFRVWAWSHGYSDELTLDRIDPDGNYEPDNCRWATWLEQRHNQRRCKEVVK